MNTDLAERRKSQVLRLFAAAAALAAIAAITLAIEARSGQPNQISGPVVAGLAETIGEAQNIEVVSREATYRIAKIPRGWVMRDRGDFPVQQDRVTQLRRALERLQFVRRMTSDPTKHERLGVDDPREGGRGVLVRVTRGDTALLVDLIFGVEPGGRIYARRAAQDQVWEVRVDDPSGAGLPPLRDLASWLNLRPLTMPAENLLRVEIMPAEGRAYVLARPQPGQPWRIAAPALDAASQSIVTATAEQVLSLAPADVVEAPAVQGGPRARVRAWTADGLAIDGELIESGGKTWLKLVARAQAPEQEAAALALNASIAGWAYALTEADAGALAPPLASLLPAPASQ